MRHSNVRRGGTEVDKATLEFLIRDGLAAHAHQTGIVAGERAEIIVESVLQSVWPEVERLRDELSRAAGLAMALMAHVPDDLLVGNLRPRALAFCREWGELQGHVDGVRAEIQAEREACAAIADAMAADAVAAREIFGEREDIAKNVYREFGHLVFETARAIAAAIRAR